MGVTEIVVIQATNNSWKNTPFENITNPVFTRKQGPESHTEIKYFR